MAAFLVTGNPGSGKSTIAAELTRRGLIAIDPDYETELSGWEDAAGTAVDGPEQPDETWLRSHRWVWRRSRLTELVVAKPADVFVCGIARNQDELLDLFDAVFLLDIGAATQEKRLAAHDAAHPPGRSEAGRQEIRAGRAVFQTQMLNLGATPIDASAPPIFVTDTLELLTATPTPTPDVNEVSDGNRTCWAGPCQGTTSFGAMTVTGYRVPLTVPLRAGTSCSRTTSAPAGSVTRSGSAYGRQPAHRSACGTLTALSFRLSCRVRVRRHGGSRRTGICRRPPRVCGFGRVIRV